MSTSHSGKERLADWSCPSGCSRQREEDDNHPPVIQLNLKESEFPEIKSSLGDIRQCTQTQLLQIYTGVRWYKFLGKKLNELEVPILVGELVGRPLTKIPPFVSKFQERAGDPLTVEVRRGASLGKKDLLRQVDTVWRNPPGLDLQEKEKKTLFAKSCSLDLCCLIYACHHWVINEADKERPDYFAIKDMVLLKIHTKSKTDPKLPAIKILRDDTHKTTAKFAIFARRRKDHWVKACIDMLKQAKHPGYVELVSPS